MSKRNCPKCNSEAIKKNGFTRHGKQNHRCLDCGRQFSLQPSDDDFQEFLNPQIHEETYISCKIVD